MLFPNLTSPLLLPQSVSVQPTLQHFIRKAKSGRPIRPQEEEERENIQSLVDENVEQMSSDTCQATAPTEIKISGHPQQELHSCLERVSNGAEEKEKKRFITKDKMTNAHNPFAVQHRGVHKTKAAGRNVSVGQGNFPGEIGGEKKVLSLKRRKRKLPPSAKVDGEPSEAKAVRTACGRGRLGGQTRDNCASRGLTPEGLSSDDVTMFLEYSTPLEESTRLSLRDLEQFESSKKSSGSQASERRLPVDITSSPGTPKRSSLKW